MLGHTFLHISPCQFSTSVLTLWVEAAITSSSLIASRRAICSCSAAFFACCLASNSALRWASAASCSARFFLHLLRRAVVPNSPPQQTSLPHQTLLHPQVLPLHQPKQSHRQKPKPPILGQCLYLQAAQAKIPSPPAQRLHHPQRLQTNRTYCFAAPLLFLKNTHCKISFRKNGMEQAVMTLSMPLCVAHSTYKSVLKLSKQ